MSVRLAEKLIALFWLSLLAAAPVAFLAHPGPLRWTAIAWLGLVGLLFSLENWLIVLVVNRRKGSSSLVPAVGGLLLGLAIAAAPLPGTGWWAPIGLAVDPWGVAMLGSALWQLIERRRAERG